MVRDRKGREGKAKGREGKRLREYNAIPEYNSFPSVILLKL